ncbi:MAG TPA: Hsp20/alpha crystallin family protein [Chryseolinea sp.]|nr:Hsp20/alpha crystallin family protein [Chryseolinea sp.]
MSIVRYSANEYIPTTFGNLVDRFFNDSLSRAGGSASSFVPKVDILESEKAYEISVAAPGLSKDDFKIDLNDNFLSISGERKFSKDKKENKLHVVETLYGSFKRSFSLPQNVDVSNISASYADGILEITVPKDEKKALKTTIKVN